MRRDLAERETSKSYQVDPCWHADHHSSSGGADRHSWVSGTVRFYFIRLWCQGGCKNREGQPLRATFPGSEPL